MKWVMKPLAFLHPRTLILVRLESKVHVVDMNAFSLSGRDISNNERANDGLLIQSALVTSLLFANFFIFRSRNRVHHGSQRAWKKLLVIVEKWISSSKAVVFRWIRGDFLVTTTAVILKLGQLKG